MEQKKCATDCTATGSSIPIKNRRTSAKLWCSPYAIVLTPQQIESAVRRFIAEQTAGASTDPDRPRMNLLLSGPPGTGKPEFVKYLGAALQTQVITRMGSDLLNKYVGGTERNIRQAFAQAATERAILFLDEADGLFQSRERAERSWEVTQVNELLRRMENFDGVLVCATNFASRLDSATLRRFTFKFEFDYMTAEGKRHFFTRLFASLGVGTLNEEEEFRLARIPGLTPGDYRTVRQSLYHLRAEVTADRLITALERESAAKRGSIAAPAIGFKTAMLARLHACRIRLTQFTQIYTLTLSFTEFPALYWEAITRGPTMPNELLSLNIPLTWTPLTNRGHNVPIWDYPTTRDGTNRPVIYRHVAQIGQQICTAYIGEGQSLNGPQKASLVYQYGSTQGRVNRARIRTFFEALHQPHWTEILTCDFLQVADSRQRKALEGILYGHYLHESLGWSDDIKKLGMKYLNQ